jgi:hypothetical protein
VLIIGSSLFIVVLEWSRNFTIVDPSCMEDDVDIVTYNFTVNCFQKKHAEWLPQAEVGDIVLFRRVKVSIHSLHHFTLTHDICPALHVPWRSQWRRIWESVALGHL